MSATAADNDGFGRARGRDVCDERARGRPRSASWVIAVLGCRRARVVGLIVDADADAGGETRGTTRGGARGRESTERGRRVGQG